MSSHHGDLACLFQLLSDPTRLNIVMLLAQGSRNVSSLCETLKLPQPTVSHHLAMLRQSAILSSRREGKQVFYSLNGQADQFDHTFEIHTDRFSVRVEPRIKKA